MDDTTINLKSLHITQLINLMRICEKEGVKVNLNIDNIIIVKDNEVENVKWKREVKC